MTFKVKVLIGGIITAVLVVGFLLAVRLYQRAVFEFVMSTETTVTTTTTAPKIIDIKVKVGGRLPVWKVSVKTQDQTLSEVLVRQSQRVFTKTVQISSEQLKTPQTITLVLYINGIKTFKVARLAITDVPVTLPPDPGEAGKQTLEGIDRDFDGVRDDLQREIVFMYPKRDEIRRVLRAMVKKQQQLITTNGDHEHFRELMVGYLALRSCYRFLAYGINIEANMFDPLDVMWINTEERLEKESINSQAALPYGTTIYYGIDSCTQPMVQGQY